MTARTEIAATFVNLVDAAAKGEDASNPAVAAPIQALKDVMTSWRDGGMAMPAVEPVFQAANALLNALHEANPEGLPYGVRDCAMETQTILDEAEEDGYAVSAPASPAP